jgi:hypothetical protein
LTNLTTTSYTDTNVINGHTYYYVVSAVNDLGETANSLSAIANVSALTVWFKADAITNLTMGLAFLSGLMLLATVLTPYKI